MERIKQFFLFILLVGAPLLGTPSDCSFLLSHLLKSDLTSIPTYANLSDLNRRPSIPESLNLTSLTPDANKATRFKTLAPFPIGKIIAAPGHRLLRKPGQVAGLTDYIKNNSGGDFSEDRILLNVITDKSGKIKEVDLWNAHHRLVAYLQAGYQTIGDLQSKNLTILVNGRNRGEEIWPHFLPSAGIELKEYPDFHIIPVGGDIRVGTVGVSGELSNYDLGSRSTIQRLAENTFRKDSPRIGVYFGTFDPLHENHVNVARTAKEQEKLDEVIFVPNLHAAHKPSATAAHHRLNMSAARLGKEPGFNLYVGDSDSIIDNFGRAPLFERFGQIYGTHQIYQVIGQDSFDSMIKEGQFIEKPNRLFLVHPRGENAKAIIPDELKDIAKPLVSSESQELSSTIIRKKIAAGQPVPASELDPELLDYIKENGLYR